MTEWMCRIVLLSCVVSSAGCYAMHESDPPPRVAEAGIAPIDAGFSTVRPDAAVVRTDAGSGLRCELTPAAAMCGYLPLQARIPTVLPLVFDACTCCAMTECAVSIARTGHIELTTTLCPDPCDCDRCEAPTAACELPGLPAGDWRVSINGAPAFILPVVDGEVEASLPLCVTRASQDRCAPSTVFDALSPWNAGALCAQQGGVGFEPSQVEVFGDCVGCAYLAGPCTAAFAERPTFDLPPGGDLHLDLLAFPTSCDVDCPAMCFPGSRRCITPELRSGDFYRVFVGDEQIGSFTAGSGERSCERRD